MNKPQPEFRSKGSLGVRIVKGIAVEAAKLFSSVLTGDISYLDDDFSSPEQERKRDRRNSNQHDKDSR